MGCSPAADWGENLCARQGARRGRAVATASDPTASPAPWEEALTADLRALAERIAEDVRKGRRLEPGVVKEAVEPMVESLLRNADALFWLMALMKRDDYAYSHAVNCSACAAACFWPRRCHHCRRANAW